MLAEVVDDVEELVAASARFRPASRTSRDVVAARSPGRHAGRRHRSASHGEAVVRVEYSQLAAKQRVRAWVRLLALTAAARPGRGGR